MKRHHYRHRHQRAKYPMTPKARLDETEFKNRVLGVFMTEVYKKLKLQSVINLTVENHFDGKIDSLTINEESERYNNVRK